MKETLIVIALVAAPLAAFAQGKVQFYTTDQSLYTLAVNPAYDLAPDAPLAGEPIPTSGPLPSGVVLEAGLYGGTNSTSMTLQNSVLINPLGGTTAPDGHIVATHTICTFPGGSLDYFQVFIWDSAYASPQASAYAGSYYGANNIFQMTPGTGIAYPGIENGGGTTWTAVGDESPLYVGVTVTNTPPTIDSQPQSLTVSAGDTASFDLTLSGAVPLFLQWTLNGANIPRANSVPLIISNVVQSDLGTYAVVVTNPFGTTNSSDATLSMYPFLATPFGGAVAYWGKDATLSVGAWGTGPLTYQWFKDGVAMQDATNQTLVLTNVQFTNAGLYSVVVTSPLGSVTNTPEQVVVEPAGVSLGLSPTITISGVTGYTYIIQGSTNLADTNSWLTLTNLTLAQPVELWVDTNLDASLPANPYHFYRVLPGQ